MSHTTLGTISKATLSMVAICLALSTSSAHAAEGITVDLVQETYDTSLEHSLFVGSVTRASKPTADTAVCLAAFVPGKRPVPVGEPILVALVKAGQEGVAAMASAGDYCQGSQCRLIGMRVADHNVELDGYAHGTRCADPYRIAKRFDMHEVMLADLNAVETPAVEIGVNNIYDNGMMTMEVLADRFRQTCTVPSGDADVRYGLGWTWDGSMSHHYLPASSLYVCSEGVRVCSFSGAFMEEGFNSVEVRGNDENNTIMLSAPSGIAIDGERYCVAAAEAGSGSEHYKVYGWPEEWRAHMRILGRGGHDWLVGGPTSDTIYGGEGDDMLRGAGGSGNRLYGQGGRDIMHDAVGGLCDGGPPEPDSPCYTDEWVWPPMPYPAGDCCCHSCDNHRNCFHSDATPGGPAAPPAPW